MDKYILNGHSFDTLEEYEQAKREKKGIAFVCSQMDLADINKVKSVYEEISKQNIFKTSIGIEFLNKLKEIIDEKSPNTDASEPEDIVPIPDSVVPHDTEAGPVTTDTVPEQRRELLTTKHSKKQSDKNLKLKEKLFTSIILNIIMAIIIAVMMYIASTSNSVTIINYENKLQDKYSSWAEELKNKEEQLREYEKQINEETNSQK